MPQRKETCPFPRMCRIQFIITEFPDLQTCAKLNYLVYLQGAEDGGRKVLAVEEGGDKALVLRLGQILILAQDLTQLLVGHSFIWKKQKKISSGCSTGGKKTWGFLLRKKITGLITRMHYRV